MRRRLAYLSFAGLVGAGLMGLVASAGSNAAEPYPSRPITIVMGISKGGITDVATRLYADIVARELGQPVVIDNRPTDSGVEAAALVQNAAPDGYTLLAFSGAQHGAIAAMRPVPYEPVAGFAPVTVLFTMVNFLAVPDTSPANSLANLLQMGRDRPAGLSFGSSGLGSTSHLTAARLAQSSGTRIAPKHYAGAVPMIADLVAGRLDFALVSYAVAGPYAREKKLKLLAVDAVARWPDFPAIPTLREAGANQPKVASWFALAAPKGTPPAIIRRLSDAFARASRNPSIIKGLHDNGALITSSTPQSASTELAREVAQTATLIRTLNLSQP